MIHEMIFDRQGMEIRRVPAAHKDFHDEAWRKISRKDAQARY
jgi:hypothetical protein